jgi:hypothetical protein
MISTSGRGRPSKYNSKTPDHVISYIDDSLKDGIFPTIEGLAISLGVGTRTLYDWEGEYPDFSQTLNKLRDIQKQLLITNGITGAYNTRFSIFLLKASHGMTEKEPLITSTQNNNMNISPDLLAEALKLMQGEDE